MNSRGVAAQVAGDPRGRGADPGLRRERPRRGVRRRGPLRPRRVRGPAADGRARRRPARRPRRAAARAAARAGSALSDAAAAAPSPSEESRRPVRRRSAALAVPDAAVLGRPDRPRASSSPSTRRYLDERAHVRRASGGCAGRAAATGPSLRGARRDRGPAAPADVARAGADRGPARGRRRLRLLPVRLRGRRPRRAERRRLGPAALHLPAAAPRPAAVPGRLLPLARRGGRARRARRRRVPAGHHGPAGRRGDRRAVREERLPRLPGAARPVGAADRGARRVLARAGPRGARLRRRRRPRARRDPAARATAGRATRSATPPAPTSRTARSWSSCCGRSGSASSCPRSCSSHPEQSTDALVVHHPEAKYFNAT